MSEQPRAAPPRSTGRSSALISAGIMLSRVLGLLRQTLIARYLGAGPVADAFNGAFRITNFLQNLFGEGVLSASFIPVYSKAVGEGRTEDADRIAGAVASILALVTALIVALGVVFAPAVAELIVGGYSGEKLALTIRLTRILFPGAAIFVLSAWCLGILNSHRRFFLSYVAPVFWNVAMIVALVAFGPRRGEVDLAVVIAWASVIGAALQMGIQLPAVFRLLGRPRFAPDLRFPPVRVVLGNFLPAFVSRGVVQLSGFIDVRLASSIPVHGVVTLLQNAQTIYMLPISVFGMAVSAAELPELSRDSGSDEAAYARLRARLDAALPRVAYFVVPSAVAFMIIGAAIAGVLLQYGKFSSTDTMRTWAILAGSALGLLPSALGRLYSSTYYALHDTRTPLRFALVRLALTGALGYVFAFHAPRLLGLDPWTGAAGLTVSGGLAAWMEYALLRQSISRRIGQTGIARGALMRMWGSALLAGAAGWGVMQMVTADHHVVRGLAAIAIFGAVYGAATLALGVSQARDIAAKVLRR